MSMSIVTLLSVFIFANLSHHHHDWSIASFGLIFLFEIPVMRDLQKIKLWNAGECRHSNANATIPMFTSKVAVASAGTMSEYMGSIDHLMSKLFDFR